MELIIRDNQESKQYEVELNDCSKEKAVLILNQIFAVGLEIADSLDILESSPHLIISLLKYRKLAGLMNEKQEKILSQLLDDDIVIPIPFLPIKINKWIEE